MADTQAIENDMTVAKKYISQSDKLKELQQTQLYKDVIEEFYMKEYVLQAVYVSSDPAWQSEAMQKDITNTISGVSSFKQWIKETHEVAEACRADLLAQEQTLSELEEGDE